MSTDKLTPRQLRERDFHDEQVGAEPQDKATKIDVFSDTKKYGPWNPYWNCFDFVRSRYLNGEQKVLCFGCGKGAEAVRYARMGYDVYGFDISPRSIERAQSLAEKHDVADRIHLSVQTAENVDYPDSFFDLVAGEDVLHHVDIESAFREIHRVLKPGGEAVFHDSLRTPVRDWVRHTAIIRWWIPVGTKDAQTGLKYESTEDESPMSKCDLALARLQFPNLKVKRFRVLALGAVLFSRRRFLEKCDHVLFKILPFMRRFGDEIVLTMQKT